MILELDNVELWFKNKAILTGIYFKAETGCVTSVLGRNGSGKSCLMSIIFGQLKPKYKLIRINGKPILKPLFKLKIATYLPQFNTIPKAITLNTMFTWFSIDWLAFSNRFEAFSGFKNQRFGNLSGGQRRFIEIYIALKANRHIVLLDEPFNGLSPILIEQIKLLINEEKASKIIILTDHKYQDVLSVSDATYLIHNGNTQLISSNSQLEDYGYLNFSL